MLETVIQQAQSEQFKDCMSWAFGEDWKSLKIEDMFARWNDRHKNIFEIQYAHGTFFVALILQTIAVAYINNVVRKN